MTAQSLRPEPPLGFHNFALKQVLTKIVQISRALTHFCRCDLLRPLFGTRNADLHARIAE